MSRQTGNSTATVSRSALGEDLCERLEALPSASRLTAEQLEAVYALAYAHVVQRQYDQALRVFALLSLYGPTRKHYLVGLALCLQKVGRHDEAASMYGVVLVLYPDAWEAALQMAECQAALGQTSEALAMLEHLDQVGSQMALAPAWLGRVRALRAAKDHLAEDVG